jgi:hypothetical protein
MFELFEVLKKTWTHPFNKNLMLLQAPHEHNTIYIRDVDFVRNRVSTAGKIKVQNQVF